MGWMIPLDKREPVKRKKPENRRQNTWTIKGMRAELKLIN